MFNPWTKQVGITAGFGLALLILAAIAVLSYKTSSTFIATSAKVAHTHEVIAKIEALNAQLLKAESGQRSFIISGDESYLAPYETAVRVVNEELPDLRALVADNPAQQHQLDDLEPVIERRFQRLQEGVELRRRQSLEAVADFIRRGSGKALMDSISAKLSEMTDEENRLLKRRSAATEAATRQTIMATLIGSFVAFLLIAVAGFIVKRDLNKRQQAEAELRASKARLAGILNIADDAVISIGDDHRVTMFNQGAERIFGYAAAEVIGQPLNLLLPTRFTATHHEYIAEMAASPVTSRKMGERRNIFGHRKDGSEFPAEASISKLEMGEERIFTVMLRDITDRKREETARAQFAALVESSADAILSKTPDGIITSWNRGAENLFGYSAAEAVGQPITMLIAPERINEETEILARIMRGESLEHLETVRIRKDGKPIDVSVTISPIKNQEGETIGVSKIARDITDPKRAEAEIKQLNASLESQMIELQAANKELESFSYSVSHDLRAPLRAIDGFSRILMEDYTDRLDSEGHRVLNVIRSNTLKMADLINDLLEFSRLGRRSMDNSVIAIEDLAKSAFDDLRAVNPEQVLELRINRLPYARGDRAMLRQVLVNLLTNAVKFTRARAVSQIAVGSQLENDQTVYYVRDNGVGFDMQYVNKLFGVFQRLHSDKAYEGTGVGLAIVQRIIHRHGGRVWATGEVGKGATFYFTLHEKEQIDGHSG